MKLERADFENWRLRPLWSLEEGIQLLFGIEPIKNVLRQLRYLEEQRYHTPVKFGKELQTRLDIGIRSIRSGLLMPDRFCFEPVGANEFVPRKFLAWAQTNAWDVPDELTSLLESVEPNRTDREYEAGLDQSANPDKPRRERERDNLFKTIGVLVRVLVENSSGNRLGTIEKPNVSQIVEMLITHIQNRDIPSAGLAKSTLMERISIGFRLLE